MSFLSKVKSLTNVYVGEAELFLYYHDDADVENSILRFVSCCYQLPLNKDLNFSLGHTLVEDGSLCTPSRI